jgi:uncharacterized protein (TIGR00251 family)
VTLRIEQKNDGVRIAVKAVPGSSRDRIAGAHGEELKVCVAAPPEKGKANVRICELVAEALSVPARDVDVVSGAASAHKVVHARGIDAATAAQRLTIATARQ